MDITIYRGTTPTLKCILPTDLTADIIQEIWLTFKFIDIRTGQTDKIDYFLSDGSSYWNKLGVR